MIEFDNLNINNIYNVDIDYNKLIYVNYIFNEIDFLIDIFNKEIKQVIIKIFIYYKKFLNKVFEPYINLVNLLSKLEHIDQYEYLNILINVIKILINAKKVESIVSEINIKLNSEIDYINIIKINKLLYKFVNNFINKNYLLKYLILFIKNNDNQNIIKISSLLAKEYYMYYSGNDIFLKFSFIFNNHKVEFIKNYNTVINNLNNLYEDNNFITKKYKYNFKNNNIINIMNSLVKLNNII